MTPHTQPSPEHAGARGFRICRSQQRQETKRECGGNSLKKFWGDGSSPAEASPCFNDTGHGPA